MHHILFEWRREISAEIDAAVAELAEAEAASAEAADSRQAARLERAALRDAIAKIARPAAALAVRASGYHREVSRLDGGAEFHRRRIQVLHALIEDLRSALDQIDAIMRRSEHADRASELENADA